MSAVHVDDPETGKRYWYIGCSKCQGAIWGVAVDHEKPARSGRIAFVCVNCGHASKGHVTMDDALQAHPDGRSNTIPPATL